MLAPVNHAVETRAPHLKALHSCAASPSPAILAQRDILEHIVSFVPPTQWPALCGVSSSFRQAVLQQPVSTRLQNEHDVRLPKTLQTPGLAIYLRLQAWQQRPCTHALPNFVTWDTTPSVCVDAPSATTPQVTCKSMQTNTRYNHSPDYKGLEIYFPDASAERRLLTLRSRNYEPRQQPPWWRACYSPQLPLRNTSIQLFSNSLGDMIGTLDSRGRLSLWDFATHRRGRFIKDYHLCAAYDVPQAQWQRVLQAKNLTLQLTNMGMRLSLDMAPQYLHFDVSMWPQNYPRRGVEVAL